MCNPCFVAYFMTHSVGKKKVVPKPISKKEWKFLCELEPGKIGFLSYKEFIKRHEERTKDLTFDFAIEKVSGDIEDLDKIQKKLRQKQIFIDG